MMLKRKHSTANKEDVRLPAMVYGLKSRLKDLARNRLRLPTPPANHEKYMKTYTPEKMNSLVVMFLPLYAEFSKIPMMSRKKLY